MKTLGDFLSEGTAPASKPQPKPQADPILQKSVEWAESTRKGFRDFHSAAWNDLRQDTISKLPEGTGKMVGELFDLLIDVSELMDKIENSVQGEHQKQMTPVDNKTPPRKGISLNSSMDINSFVAGFQDGARPNRFQVNLTFPSFAGSAAQTDILFIKAASIPSSKMGVVNVNFQGRTYPLFGDRTFDPWKVTITNDVNFTLRNKFEKWMNAMNTHTTNTILAPSSALADYSVPADVYQLGKDGSSVLASYHFVNMWPSEITAIELSQDSKDAIETFDVTLQYVAWENTSSTS